MIRMIARLALALLTAPAFAASEPPTHAVDFAVALQDEEGKPIPVGKDASSPPLTLKIVALGALNSPNPTGAGDLADSGWRVDLATRIVSRGTLALDATETGKLLSVIDQHWKVFPVIQVRAHQLIDANFCASDQGSKLTALCPPAK